MYAGNEILEEDDTTVDPHQTRDTTSSIQDGATSGLLPLPLDPSQVQPPPKNNPELAKTNTTGRTTRGTFDPNTDSLHPGLDPYAKGRTELQRLAAFTSGQPLRVARPQLPSTIDEGDTEASSQSLSLSRSESHEGAAAASGSGSSSKMMAASSSTDESLSHSRGERGEGNRPQNNSGSSSSRGSENGSRSTTDGGATAGENQPAETSANKAPAKPQYTVNEAITGESMDKRAASFKRACSSLLADSPKMLAHKAYVTEDMAWYTQLRNTEKLILAGAYINLTKNELEQETRAYRGSHARFRTETANRIEEMGAPGLTIREYSASRNGLYDTSNKIIQYMEAAAKYISRLQEGRVIIQNLYESLRT